jgi:RHS repeat-associated protein
VQDHLGNNRLVVDEKGTIEQINHYYPFGGLMGESKNISSNQRYKYNGKELDRMNGLDSYDYGARLHNAPVGRWMSVDPLAEVDYNISPYVYCGDNPVIYTDPTGKVFGIDNVIGGLASGAIEVGTQIIGQRIGNERYHITWSKVGVAVAEGFITSGASTGVRVATKVASALANSYIDNKGKGGYKEVQTIEDRDALQSTQRLETGCIVYVIKEDTEYRWDSPEKNTWNIVSNGKKIKIYYFSFYPSISMAASYYDDK